MAKVKVRATKQDVKEELEGGGDFVSPKPGFYHLTVIEANAGFSKDRETGAEDKSRPRIEMVYEITAEGVEGDKAPEANYGRIWDYLTFGEKAGRTRARYIKTFYPEHYSEDGDMEVEFDTDEMIAKTVVAKLSVKKEKDQNGEVRDRVQIRQMMPVGDDFSSAAVSTADAFASADDDDNDFESVLEEAEEEGEEDGLLTEEELDAMTSQEVAAIAKEFDLDTKDFIVKFKSGANKGKVKVPETKAAVIAAILEAQGSNEEDDGDEDESPF